MVIKDRMEGQKEKISHLLTRYGLVRVLLQMQLQTKVEERNNTQVKTELQMLLYNLHS